MELRWIDSEGVSGRDLAELPDLRTTQRRISLAGHSRVGR